MTRHGQDKTRLVVLYEEDELIEREGGKRKGVVTRKNKVGEKGRGWEFLEGEGRR
jgi:hypothetical protein